MYKCFFLLKTSIKLYLAIIIPLKIYCSELLSVKFDIFKKRIKLSTGHSPFPDLLMNIQDAFSCKGRYMFFQLKVLYENHEIENHSFSVLLFEKDLINPKYTFIYLLRGR